MDLIDEAIGRGLVPRVIVADADCGQIAAFRHALAERALDFVAARSGESAHSHDAVSTTPAWSGNRCKPAARYRTQASSLKELTALRGLIAARAVRPERTQSLRMRSRRTEPPRSCEGLVSKC
ncbi:transposase [Streptosporangium sp. NPDC002721]|uniref:transposase n=1 Tax=Streptosporangium sp. NPDC002721 TaxID=3366188 RepID=UPI0036810C3A